jgi:hypothetical protein
MSHTDALTAAAVEAMNAADWSVEFTARYELIPDFVRESMREGFLQVVCVPANLSTTDRLDRRRSKKDVSFDVGFAVLVADAARETVRPWIAFVESVQTWFDEEQRLLSGLSYLRSEFDPLYDATRLRTDGVFFSILAVTYRKG